MMKKLAATVLVLCMASPEAMATPDKYDFDKDHTHIIFFISHEGFSDTIGRFDAFDGYFTFDETHPEDSSLDVTLKSASVDTGAKALDSVLCTDKFFKAQTFPDIHFKSNAITVTGKHTGDVAGMLTLLGVTRPLLLHVKYNRSGIHPFTNNYVSGFSADAVLNRSDFGMNAYPHDVGDVVRIHIEAEGTDPLKHPGNSKAPH